MKIISGGQTGVDRAALDVALSLGLSCGGWCPAGRFDENGVIPPHYPLEELPAGGYLERTARNVSEADGTIIFYTGSLQGGTKATADFCSAQRKPSLLIDASAIDSDRAADLLAEFVREHRLEVLNVAGPRASQWLQGYDFVCQALSNYFRAAALSLSFVVPAHNEEHELPASLGALRAAADASGQPYELIVVDDASTDATAEIARQFGAHVTSISRRQIAAARNAGAALARGQILFFVDADTQIAPDHVVLGLQAINDGCSGGSARVLPDRKLPFWANVFLHAFSAIYFTIGLGAGAFIFARRDLFEKAGGFDEQYFAGEEVYLSLALKKLGRFKILRQPIITSARKVRMHSPRFVLTQTFFLLLGGKGSLRTRDRLALWYDGKRERPAT
ncbi:MAG: putative molybdenum carrier protein [Spartobacteria bacterium]